MPPGGARTHALPSPGAWPRHGGLPAAAVVRGAMRLHLIAVGRRVPDWVEAGYRDYARRLRGEFTLRLHPVASVRRGAGADAARAVRVEGRALLKAVPAGGLRVALDARGATWSTAQLAARLDEWRAQWRDVAFLVGGADGLSDECRGECEHRWSLSALTLPHALVRVVVAEQLYRAWSILARHPYHR